MAIRHSKLEFYPYFAFVKKLVLSFFIFYSSLVFCQQQVIIVLNDSAFLNLDSGWVFSPEDKPEMATKDYNDASWKNILPEMNLRLDTSKAFKGIGWFRLHFHADSTITKIPMALKIEHSGASEIYFDGKLLEKNGVIKDKENSEYYNPKNNLIPFVIIDTGVHVLAVRYANFNADYNKNVLRYAVAGFELHMGRASIALSSLEGSVIGSYISLLLFSLFATIALVHLLLFLYNRASVSNLYFSILTFGSSLLFFYALINIGSGDAGFKIFFRYLIIPVVCVISFALSGVINSVFPDKRKWRFWFIGILTSVVILSSIFNWSILSILVLALEVLVSLEAVVKIIIALIKKQKGSRIIGIGFFFFVFFLLCIMVVSVATDGSFDISDETLTGKIIIVCIVASILSIPFSMSAYLANNFATVSKDLRNQLAQVKLLSDKTLEQEQEKKRLLESRKEELEKEVQVRTEQVMQQKDKIEKQHGELMLEKKKSDDLLLNILPSEVAEELKLKGSSEARYFTDVTVLFTDFVNFTKVSEQLSPQELVSEIHDYFRVFDEIISSFGLEKIKTIGDAYLAVCGLPEPNENHAINAVKAAIAIRDYIAQKKEEGGLFEIRIGLNSGPVVAGIVGVKKFAYDIWGDTVNTAARMEQNSEAGKINISGSTYELVKTDFECTNRGKIDAKNKGMIDMYFVM